VETPKLCSSLYATGGLLCYEGSRINDVLTKLYENVVRYSAEDCWYFDIPLAI
jgi:hypothetical protein